jgi:archaeosine-15-forming tRNA-guanine transglycosylase
LLLSAHCDNEASDAREASANSARLRKVWPSGKKLYTAMPTSGYLTAERDE